MCFKYITIRQCIFSLFSHNALYFCINMVSIYRALDTNLKPRSRTIVDTNSRFCFIIRRKIVYTNNYGFSGITV